MSTDVEDTDIDPEELEKALRGILTRIVRQIEEK